MTSHRVREIELSDLILALDEISEFLDDMRAEDEASVCRDDVNWMLSWIADAADQLQHERNRVIASAENARAS